MGVASWLNGQELLSVDEGIHMSATAVMSLAYKAMMLGISLSAPVLLVTLIVGLIVSVFQAATQINEATLSFIPKVIGTCIALVILGPWMIGQSIDFIKTLFSSIPQLAGG